MERRLCIPYSGEGKLGSSVSNPLGLLDLRPRPSGQKKGCGEFLRASRKQLPLAAARSSRFLRKAGMVADYKTLESPEQKAFWGSWIRIISGSQNCLPVKKVPKKPQNLPWCRKLALWLYPVPISRLRQPGAEASSASAFHLRNSAG